MKHQCRTDDPLSALTPSNSAHSRLGDRLSARLTRRGVLSATGLAGVGLLASQLDLLQSAAQDSTAVLAIIEPLATLESLAVTMIGVGRQRGDDLGIATNASRFLRAAQCEDEAHYHFLTAAGAKPDESFSIAEDVFDDRESYLSALFVVKEIAVGATMAAARQFAARGELGLVEIAYQIGTTEAQHLALARFFRGDQIANDRAFAKWRFTTSAESRSALTDAGYLGGDGDSFAFPGPLSRQCRGVFGLVPETTDDQFPPPSASPVADG